MNRQEREHIGRLIQRFAVRAPTDDLLILIAETSGMFEACSRLVREADASDQATTLWLHQQCEAARVRPTVFLAEIKAILTVFRPSEEHGDLYAQLELEPGASLEAIKQSYRRLCRRYHPDTAGGNRDDAAFMRITNAYHRLLHGEAQIPLQAATRREGSHWRRSLAPDTTDARRTQKRRNILMVALLSLVLIFVSLLAARTYNSRVMMSGLKNKGLALVPPTDREQASPPTAPITKPAAAPVDTVRNAPEQGVITIAAMTTEEPHKPPPPDTAKDVANTNSPQRTAPDKSDASPDRTIVARSGAVLPSAVSRQEGQTATPVPPAMEPDTLASEAPPAAAEAEPMTSTRNKEAAASTKPPPSANEQAVHLSPGIRKTMAPVAVSAAKHQAAVPAEGAKAVVSPAVQEKATEPIETAQHGTVRTAPNTTKAKEQPVHQPAPAETAQSEPPSQNPQPSPVRSPQPAAQPIAVTASTLASTTPPQPQASTEHQIRARIDTFLQAYTGAYEQKNLQTFSRFFAVDATENGKALSDVLSAYTDLFTSAQTLRFTVSPQTWQQHQGQLLLRGRFSIAMTFKDGVSRAGQGDIDFRLSDTNSPQVQSLRYSFDK